MIYPAKPEHPADYGGEAAVQRPSPLPFLFGSYHHADYFD